MTFISEKHHSPDCPVQRMLGVFFHNHALSDAFRHPVAVALSGGLDSTVLLHALVARGVRVQALHVHHQLQAVADDWPSHCAAFCKDLGVPFVCLPVVVEDDGAGLEANARLARYRAVFNWMNAHHMRALFCAHHQDDQLETILLQMLRGSGLRGIAGMQEFGPVGVDRHAHPDLRLCRPLLACSKADLQAYAARHALGFVSDPSNSNTSLRRNWVRLKLLPELRDHFPQADLGLLRVASHFRDYFHEIDEQYTAVKPQVCDSSGRLKLTDWQLLNESTRLQVLQSWLLESGIRCGKDKLTELHRQLVTARQGGKRQVATGWLVLVSRGKATATTVPL